MGEAPEFSRGVGGKFLDEDLLPAASGFTSGIAAIHDELLKFAAPADRGPYGRIGGGLLRERGSELAQRRDRAELALARFKKYFEGVPRDHLFRVIDAIETGNLLNLNPTEQAIPTMKEGMNDPNFKLVPAFDNPVDYVLAKLAEEDKSITAHMVKEEMIENGTTKYIPWDYHGPKGWAKIEDKLFTQYGKPTVTVTEAFDKLLRERLYKLADTLGIKHERKVSIGGSRRLGYSSKAQGKIVTKFGGPDSIIAHEIGHQLEDKFHLMDLLKKRDYPERTRELRALADLRFEGDLNVSKSYKA